VETFAFHSYANMVEDPTLIDPTVSAVARAADASGYLCSAAARGDLSELRRLIAAGADVSRSDYDGRTALHLAACEGREEVVRLLIATGCGLEPKDRWGNTPLDEAVREGRHEIVALLRPGAATSNQEGQDHRREDLSSTPVERANSMKVHGSALKPAA
jgi:glutaminase